MSNPVLNIRINENINAAGSLLEATLDKNVTGPTPLIVQGLMVLGAAQEGLIQERRKVERALERKDIRNPSTDLLRKAGADFQARYDFLVSIENVIDTIREDVQWAVYRLSMQDDLAIEHLFKVKKHFRTIRDIIFDAADQSWAGKRL